VAGVIDSGLAQRQRVGLISRRSQVRVLHPLPYSEKREQRMRSAHRGNPMSLPWFRMYTDFLRDPKMLSLAFEDQRHFVAILALKSDGVIDSGASGTMLDRMVAQFIWVDFSAIHEVKRRLIGAGLIGDDWQPVAWDKRQYASDSSKARVRKFRENKRKASDSDPDEQTVTCNGLGNVTCNDDETGAVTKGNGLDTDTDTDTEPPATTRARAYRDPPPRDHDPDARQTSGPPPAWLRDDLDATLTQAAATRPGDDRDPAFRMHDTWVPSPRLAEHCRQSGIPPELDPGLLVEFRSYWSAESTALRHSQWEHKLLRQMLYAHRNQQANPAPTPGGSHATGRYPRAASAADIDFADTSWLDERTIERCRSAVGQRGV
jgi:hypothetical protein